MDEFIKNLGSHAIKSLVVMAMAGGIATYVSSNNNTKDIQEIKRNEAVLRSDIKDSLNEIRDDIKEIKGVIYKPAFKQN